MFSIRTINDNDRDWMRKRWMEWWSALFVICRNRRIYHVDEVDGFIAEEEGKPIGLLTFVVEGEECEITSLNSLKQGMGIGTRLMNILEENAKKERLKRIWVVTTNDNLNALRFYQKRGYRMFAVDREGMDWVRKMKPEIPLLGADDIPLRDMIELVKDLQ